MEALLYVALFTVLALLVVLSNLGRGSYAKKRAPSPPALPVIGHLHLLRGPLHLAMQRLAGRYGPVVSLLLGSRPALLVSSPAAVEECFTTNDVAFSNRPDTIGARILGFDRTAMFLAPHGPHWRNMRRIAAIELLSSKQLGLLSGIRAREVPRLVKQLAEAVDGEGLGRVALRPRLFEMAYSAVSEAVTGKRYHVHQPRARLKDAKWFSEIVREVIELVFAFNPEDFFPFLAGTDIKGLNKRMVKLRKKVEDYSGMLLEEHRRQKRKTNEFLGSEKGAAAEEGDGSRKRTMLDVLLSLQQEQPEYYTDELIKGLIMVFLTGGTGTLAETIESAMLLLLCHPKVLEKARAEMDMHVGQHRLIEEPDVPKLPYLHCIIQEALRLCPPNYGMPPRESSEDCTVQGFHVPRGTMLLVNVWSMQRDPNLWKEPAKFEPERFAGVQGWNKEFKYLPFGSGRRGCPGEAMAMRIFPFALGALIQCFEWEPVEEEEVNRAMTENKPFVASYKLRASMIDSISIPQL